MIAQVIDRRGRQDQVGPGPSQGLDDPSPRLVVVEDRQVAELQAEVLGPDQLGGGRPPRRGGSRRSPRRRARRCRSRRASSSRSSRGNRPPAAGPASPRTGTRRRRGGRATPGRGRRRRHGRPPGSQGGIASIDSCPVVYRSPPTGKPSHRSGASARILRRSQGDLRKSEKMFSRALDDRCTLATKGSGGDRPCRSTTLAPRVPSTRCRQRPRDHRSDRSLPDQEPLPWPTSMP